MISYKQEATHNSPGIYLSTDENRFELSGKSAPEDVRGLYYPVIEWVSAFGEELKTANHFTERNPLVFKIDLVYFNSSSAKFLFDIFTTLKDIQDVGTPVVVEWHYDDEDTDLREAGEDLAMITGIDFKYCPKNTNTL